MTRNSCRSKQLRKKKLKRQVTVEVIQRLTEQAPKVVLLLRRLIHLKQRTKTGLGLVLLMAIMGCTSQSPRARFLMAEKLWQEQRYEAAVAEYDKVQQKEGPSDLGIQALLRSAQTETLFLNHHLSAIRRLNRLLEMKSGTPIAKDADKLIGEILFQRLEAYDQAITQYTRMIEKDERDPDRPEYFYRVGKSQYYLTRFNEAAQTYEALIRLFPSSRWAEKSQYDLGLTWSALAGQRQVRGESASEAWKTAIMEFEQFKKTYGQSPLITHVEFDIASCYEELEQLTEAEEILSRIKFSDPREQALVDQKLNRIKSRKTQKNLKE
ncbi:MAG: tetratricopeptide repeat protein [Proteobacteria bacterium]|nr:MAG: tetratricopeptide repeat protein [Pseudomonadota bacterium]